MEVANRIDVLQNFGLNLEKAYIYIASEIDTTLSTYLRIKVDMIQEFYQHELHKDLETIKIFVNSLGGDIYATGAVMDFYNELKLKGILVDTYAEGVCQSAATFLIAAGTGERVASRNCRWMVHEIQIITEEQQTLNTSAAKKEQEEYDFLQKDFYKRYAEITCRKRSTQGTLSKSAKDWENLCKQTHYFDSFEAKRLNLVDSVVKY